MLFSKERLASIKNLLYRYRHLSLLSIYGIEQIWFMYCERTVVPKYYTYSFLDAYIPFIKEFVIPYLFWFVYMAAAFIYLAIVSKKDYYRLCIFIFGGMSICYTIYLILPNAQNLRPIITENDIFSRMIMRIYSTDTNTNVAPSIHVLNSIAVHIVLTRCPRFRRMKFWNAASCITMITVSASTVFIKQHSIVDGMWSILLSAVLYACIYRLPRRVAKRRFFASNTKELSAS